MGAGISNRRSSGDYSDEGYRPKSRDHDRQSPRLKIPRQAREELSQKRQLTRQRQEEGEAYASKTQAGKVFSQKPMQSKIDQVFASPISPERALKFVSDNSGSFTHVQLADMINRTSDFLQRLPVAEKYKTGVEFLHLMDEIFTVFLRNKDNLSPRELSTFLRSLSNYTDLYDHYPHYLVKGATKPRAAFETFLCRYWQKSLEWNTPNLIDLCHAGIGMMADRNFFATKNLYEEQGTAPYSEPVRKTFLEIVEKMNNPNEQELLAVIQLIRESVSNKMVSMSVLKKAEQLFLSKDETGRTKLDDILPNKDSALACKIELVYKLASFGIKRPDEIKEIEEDLKQRFDKEGQGAISTETIAEFVCACFFHNHQIERELLSEIEKSTIKDLEKRGFGQASSHKAAYLMGLGLLIQKVELSGQMERIADEAADNSGHRKSKLENQVVALIKQCGWGVSEHQKVGPCVLDALVQIDNDTVVNIEIDGFPYHYVYLIDDGKFCQTMRPASNRLRDAALERMGIPVLRLRGQDLKADEGTDPVANLKYKIESFVKQRYESAQDRQ